MDNTVKSWPERLTFWADKLYHRHPHAFAILAASAPVSVPVVVALFGPEAIFHAFAADWVFDLALPLDRERFWVLLVIGTVALTFLSLNYVRIREQRLEQKSRDRLRTLEPSIDWVLSVNHDSIQLPYDQFKDLDSYEFENYDSANINDKELYNSIRELGEHLEIALGHVIKLARDYSRQCRGATRPAVYGGSIMFGITSDQFNHLDHRHFRPVENDGCARFCATDKQMLANDSILILPQALRLLAEDSTVANFKATQPIPDALFVLPVNGDDDGKLVLPGAPEAYLTGNSSTHEDTREFALDNFDAPTRTRIRNYFSKSGAGSNVRSIASYPIFDGEYIVGAISVDCSEPGIFGTETDQTDLFLPIYTSRSIPLGRPLTLYKTLWVELERRKLAGNWKSEGV